MTAANRAAGEAAGWMELSRRWTGRDVGPGPRERDVVVVHDPTGDLHRRMGSWGYVPGRLDLADLARFAAALAGAEADGWRDGDGPVASRAAAERRFLLGDRILHWAVPWLVAVGDEHPDLGDRAAGDAGWLLDLADHHRPAPGLAGEEGRFPPGHDALGPVDADADMVHRLRSVLSGAVLLDLTVARCGANPALERDDLDEVVKSSDGRRSLCGVYEDAARRWSGTAQEHPGSAEIWRALERRARETADLLRTAAR